MPAISFNEKKKLRVKGGSLHSKAKADHKSQQGFKVGLYIAYQRRNPGQAVVVSQLGAPTPVSLYVLAETTGMYFFLPEFMVPDIEKCTSTPTGTSN